MTTDQRVRTPVRMSSTLAIHERVQRLEAEGRQVFHLGFGEARFPAHPEILAALRKHADARGYLPVAGLAALRERVAAYYARFGLEVEAARVLVGCGSKSLLFVALQALDGDVILPVPSWVSYEDQARVLDKKVTRVRTALADDHCLTPEGLEAGLRSARQAGQSPSILVLNSPNNPTGVVYPDELLERLAAVAAAEGLVIVSDEIYALCAHGEPPHRSIARHHPATVVTGGLSKHLSLGGWRLGVAVVPDGDLGNRLAQQMAAVASCVWTAASTPVQHAAVVAYSGEPAIEAYIEACASIQSRLTDYLRGRLVALGIPCPTPSGGFYLYPSFAPWRDALAERHGVRTCAELAELLLTEVGIATLPGSDFGADPAELGLRLSTSLLHEFVGAAAEEVQSLGAEQLSTAEFVDRACPRARVVAELFAGFAGDLGIGAETIRPGADAL